MYIEDHSEASFPHSICPHCARKLYGHEEWFEEYYSKAFDNR